VMTTKTIGDVAIEGKGRSSAAAVAAALDDGKDICFWRQVALLPQSNYP